MMMHYYDDDFDTYDDNSEGFNTDDDDQDNDDELLVQTLEPKTSDGTKVGQYTNVGLVKHRTPINVGLEPTSGQ